MEETLLEVSIATGTPFDVVADMDSLSFVALSEVLSRVQARNKYEAAWTAMCAAQGTKEGMEKLTKPWSQAPEKTADDFLRDFKIPTGSK